MSDIRYREPHFERKCPTCGEYVALTLEDWDPYHGFVRCRACWRAYKREYERTRNTDAAIGAAKREANRVRYYANREQSMAANQRWRDANRDRIAAYNRAYRAAHKAELSEQRAAYYAKARDVILAKKRMAYRERAA